MSEEDIEKLESVLSTEEAKKVLETALTTANPPIAEPETEDPSNFIIDEEEAKKILEVEILQVLNRVHIRNFELFL